MRHIIRLLGVGAGVAWVCWGLTSLGDSPVRIRAAESVAVGNRHACAIVDGGRVRCWGASSFGQRGNGVTDRAAASPPVTDVAGARGLASGDDFSCAIDGDRGVACWGFNSTGQLGDGTAGNARVRPVRVIDLGETQAITAGRAHACALASGGTVTCWGSNAFGQLGDGSRTDRPVPTRVDIGPATAIDAGGLATCAVLESGAVDCWGASLGSRPVRVAGVEDASAVGVGTQSACAVVADGAVRCWALDTDGPKAPHSGGRARAASTLRFGPDRAVAVSVGDELACAVSSAGTVGCWRHPSGDGTPGITTVPGLARVTGISVDGVQACAVADGVLRCWDDATGARPAIGVR
ncbi:MAG: hypothetical protein U0Q22_02655 [Acidimicrobiales bacterium]